MESKWESRKRNREEETGEKGQDTKRSDITKDEGGSNLDKSTSVPTASEYIVAADKFLALPPELKNVDFTERVSWRKFAPYNEKSLALTPIGKKPVFTQQYPALCFHVNATSKRARATTLHLPSNRPVATPIFMPVG